MFRSDGNVQFSAVIYSSEANHTTAFDRGEPKPAALSQGALQRASLEGQMEEERIDIAIERWVVGCNDVTGHDRRG